MIMSLKLTRSGAGMTRFATVAAIHHVINGPGIRDSELARHTRQNAKEGHRRQASYYNTMN